MQNLQNHKQNPNRDGYTIKDIEQEYSLPEKQIRRVLKEMPEIAKYYSEKRKNNALFFNKNGFFIFGKVAELIRQEKTVRQIRDELLPELLQVGAKPKPNQERVETPNVSESISQSGFERLEAVFSKLIEAKDQTIAAKDAIIQEKERALEQAEKRVLLLPDGRSPEQVLADSEAKERALRELTQSTAHLQAEHSNMKQKIILDQEKIALFEEREQERHEIIRELETLEGRFFVGGKRKALLAKLRDLERASSSKRPSHDLVLGESDEISTLEAKE